MSKLYRVNRRIDHDNTYYEEGDTIALEDHHAEPLLAAGAIERDKKAKAATKHQPHRTPTVTVEVQQPAAAALPPAKPPKGGAAKPTEPAGGEAPSGDGSDLLG